jgi:hypothetical protein
MREDSGRRSATVPEQDFVEARHYEGPVATRLVFGPDERHPRGPAADGDAKGRAAGTRLFGLTEVVGLHIGISADEYQDMQPPAPAAF